MGWSHEMQWYLRFSLNPSKWLCVDIALCLSNLNSAIGESNTPTMGFGAIKLTVVGGKLCFPVDYGLMKFDKYSSI